MRVKHSEQASVDEATRCYPVRNHQGFARVWLLVSLLIGLAVMAWAAPDTTANIGVSVDLTDPHLQDQVTIHIVGNTDEQTLKNIVYELGDKFRATPINLAWSVVDRGMVLDEGIGIDFQLPVLPKSEQYLPIAPFIEVMAPHVTRLRILYIIKGKFTYRGIQDFQSPDVQVTVDPPQKSPADSPDPLAFYGISAIIKNPKLETVAIPNYAADQRSAGMPWWVLVLAAACFGAAAGMLVLLFLPRLKAALARDDGNTSNRE